MTKKYLLYIHHPNFAKEIEKSALVNRLLNEHYAGLDVYTSPPAADDARPARKSALDELGVRERRAPARTGLHPHRPSSSTTTDISKIPPVSAPPVLDDDGELCAHGFAAEDCRVRDCVNYPAEHR